MDPAEDRERVVEAVVPDPSVEPVRRRMLELAGIALLSLTLNLAGNGRVSLWDRDEPRYAVCVREMRARGDWFFPSFNGEPRYQKPILIYWLMRAGFALGGDNPLGARLASSVAGTASCLLLWVLGRRMFGPFVGRLSALMLATAPIMVVESKLATTDSVLTFWLLASQCCLWELGRRPSRWLAGGFWLALGLAVLTKGPVGLAVVGSAGLVSWWLGGPTGCWKRLHWRWAVPGFLLLLAPWCIAIGVASRGEFFRIALGQQFAGRLTRAVEQHGGFPGYYLVTTLAMFYPWSALLPAALYGAWVRRKGRPELGFLMGWIVGPLIVLELVQTKIVHYYVPSYPACALLSAWLIGMIAPEEINLRRWPLGRAATGILGGVGISFTVGLIAWAVVAPWGLRWPLLALALLLGLGTLYGLWQFMQGATMRAVSGLLVAWSVILFGMGVWLLPATEPYKFSRIVGERLGELAAKHHAQPVLLTFQEPSIVYALRRPAPELRNWEALHDRLARHERVVVAVSPSELTVLQREDSLRVAARESYEGFNLSKGRSQTICFAVIERAGIALRPVPREQPLVK
jgi:4-amino-4-deoxy-L-arabinose transferase-like glycosyltransferase